MPPKPLVSIISPAYNHEKYISDCIDSVLNQTYDNWEMIIVDDGSTDNTPLIAKKYSDQYPQIKYIPQSNVGIFRLAESYNKALAEARGKYIAILECDDKWSEQKLEKQVVALEGSSDFVLCWGRADLMKEDLSEKYYTAPELTSDKRIYFNNDPILAIFNILYFENCIPALTLLIRTDALNSIGGFQQPYHLPLVDLPTLYLLASIGKFYFLEDVLGAWRIYPNQVTKTYTAEIVEGHYKLAEEYAGKRNDMSAEEKSRLIKKIHSTFNNRLVIAYARAGRYNLIRKNFRAARKDYTRSLFYKGLNKPVWRLRALTGWTLSLFGLDVEWLAGLLGRATYK